MIYLDNAATTKPDQRVIEAMLPFLSEQYGNPASLYGFGTYAKRAVETAREQVAAFIGANPEQIVFTGSGTEANKVAVEIAGTEMNRRGRKGIIVNPCEHISMLNAIKKLCIKDGFYYRPTAVESDGSVSVGEVRSEYYTDDVGIVSVMAVNNETGAESDVDSIADFCKSKDVLFITDCVQAASGKKIDAAKIGCDFLTMSAHKLHGVKGAGALFVKDVRQIPTEHTGTANVPGIVAFGKACEIMKNELHDDMNRISLLKQIFYNTLSDLLKKQDFTEMRVNGQSVAHQGKILNLCFPGIDGETLLLMLGARDICVSAGAACQSLHQLPSHVLLAMGVSAEDARSSVRVSFSKNNSEDDVLKAASAFADCVVSLSD